MNIVIVGGGSAGWMTACMLVKEFPNYSVTVIESPNIPTVGVGESTINGIRQFCNYIGINEKDFLKHTDGSYKLAIQFKDFDAIGSTPFLYPFGKPDLNGTSLGLQDWMLKKYCYPETPLSDFAESFFPAALMAKHNVFFKNDYYSIFEGYNSNVGVAYHFDALKFAEWLRINYAIPKGTKHIVASVANVEVNNNSISRLTLDNELEITADLFIDCTGFSSVLLGQALKEEFIDYSDMLPNNRAWATQVSYKDKKQELNAVTTCTAISNGWVWNIPLWSRLGTGYVYSDKFITPEKALEEYKNYLKSDSMTIPRTEEELKTLSFKDIKMRIGIHKRTWVGNTVAIGLSAGFIEPLESSGLYTVHEFLFQLIRALSRGVPTSWDREVYNKATYGLFNEFAEFVAMHYSLTKRTDTEYWRSITSKDYMSTAKETPSYFEGVAETKTRLFQVPTQGGYPWLLVGMGYLSLDHISAGLGEMEHNIPYKELYKDPIEFLEVRKTKWENIIKEKNSLYEYLDKNIYNV